MTDHDTPLEQALRRGLDEARAEGRKQGIEIGQGQGLYQGIQLGVAISVMLVLEMRGLSVTPEQRGRMAQCVDMTMLNRCLRRALVVADAEAVFEAGL